MELQHFKKSKLEEKSLSDLLVTANIYSSKIVFSKPCINHLGIKKGDRLVFTKDVDTGDLYFFITKIKEDSYQLKNYSTTPMLAVCAKNLCREIVYSANRGAYKVVMELDHDTVDYEGTALHKISIRKIEMDDFIQWGDEKPQEVLQQESSQPDALKQDALQQETLEQGTLQQDMVPNPIPIATPAPAAAMFM